MDRDKILRIIKFSVISLSVLVIVILAIFQTRKLITGPKIIIDFPVDGQIFSSSTVQIRGKILDAVETTLNDRPIFIDREGNFSEIVLLSEGINYENIYGKDRFGKERKVRLTLIYQPQKNNIEPKTNIKNTLRK
jgi:hypothetical protein